MLVCLTNSYTLRTHLGPFSLFSVTVILCSSEATYLWQSNSESVQQWKGKGKWWGCDDWLLLSIWNLVWICFEKCFSWAKGLPEITSLPHKVRGKVCVHPSLPMPHLWDHIGYIVVVVVTWHCSFRPVFLQGDTGLYMGSRLDFWGPVAPSYP